VVPEEIANMSETAAMPSVRKWRTWGGCCFALALLGSFAKPLCSLVNHAARSDLHSHILLVPIVSAYVLWIRRRDLPRSHTVDFSSATVSFVCGVAILLIPYGLKSIGRVLTYNDHLALLTLSFLCWVLAGGFLFLGRHWIRAAVFPIAFLIFMVPMPDAMANILETLSKSASAEVANLFFQISGTPFIRSGTIFQLPNITIEVAQECSGIRSSWVLFITGILAANLFLSSPWRRLVLVALIIPLAILRNAFRIMVIGLLCVHLGPQMIHSPIHRQGGPFFFALSLIPLFYLLWLLRRGEAKVTTPSSKPLCRPNPISAP
jgi:exosortase C (VPDSG-CTERM-specific)